MCMFTAAPLQVWAGGFGVHVLVPAVPPVMPAVPPLGVPAEPPEGVPALPPEGVPAEPPVEPATPAEPRIGSAIPPAIAGERRKQTADAGTASPGFSF